MHSIPEIEAEIHQYYAAEDVECFAISDPASPMDFLENYCKGYLPFNSTPTTFNILYDTDEVVDDYCLVEYSTWIIVDAEGKQFGRYTNSQDSMITFIKSQIDILLY
ncbi:MAG: hypothetical protein H8E87_05290 [FCB group bacterium]|nr:hypothetical protein [FCB group bacterium]